MYKSHAMTLFENGYIPTPLIGKGEGMLKGWSSITYDEDFIKQLQETKPEHSIGLLTGIGEFPLLAIDIDIDYPEISEAISKEILNTFGVAPIRIGKAPKQLLLYLSNKPFKKIRFEFKSNLTSGQAVELLGNGQQFVAYGIHPVTKKQYEWVTEDNPINLEALFLNEIDIDMLEQWLSDTLPSLVPDDWEVNKNNNSKSVLINDEDDFLIGVPKPKPDFDKEQVTTMISIQDPNMSNDQWVKVGIALKHWDEVDGFTIWDEWSSKGDSYKKSQMKKRWDSFEIRYDGITLATYYKQYRDFLSKNDDVVIEHLSDTIKKTKTNDELKNIAKTIAYTKFDPITEITIIDEYRAKFKEITKSSISKADVQKLLRVIRKNDIATIVEEGDVLTIPEWLEDWVFVGSQNKFFKINSSDWLDATGFRLSFSRNCPKDNNGKSLSAVEYACNEIMIPTVMGATYQPSKEQLFELDGTSYVNTFNINSVPRASEAITKEGKEACDMIYNHLFKLCGGREDITRELIDWLAFNVQYMGIKLNYAPLIQGIEGVGKSFIRDMMTRVMGSNNVNTLSSTIINSSFNAFSVGSCLSFIEELKVQGHNRYEILNNVKSLITDTDIAVHGKGKDAVKAINITNYIAFTNYKDALPISDSDRRWFVIFAPWTSISEFEKDLGQKSSIYFDKLFSSMYNHISEIRQWFLEWEISKDFKASGRAPNTPDKLAMIGSTHSDEEHHVVKSIIDKGCEGISFEVISKPHLNEALKDYQTADDMDSGNLHITNQIIINVLKEMGYVSRRDPIRWQGKLIRVWLKRTSNDDHKKIIELLDRTLENPFA